MQSVMRTGSGSGMDACRRRAMEGTLLALAGGAADFRNV